MQEYTVTIRSRRSLALANQTPKVEQESSVEPPVKSEPASTANAKSGRKRKANDEIKEEVVDEKKPEDEPGEPSELPAGFSEMSKRAKRRYRAAMNRKADGRTRDGNPRPDGKVEDKGEGEG